MTTARQELVIAAGMPRSASTWLYNVIRLALDSDPRHTGNFNAGWVGDWADIEQRDCMLMKVHDFNAVHSDAAKAVLYSYRDVRDAVASQYRKFGSVASMDLVGRYIEMHEQWMPRTDYAMRYETMLNGREAILRQRYAVPYTGSGL